MGSDQPAPLGLALVICDQVIEDKLTSKKSLIGIFNNIAAPTFPCRHPQVSAFVALTDGRGQRAARLRIANEDTAATVADVTGHIQFPDPNAVVELVFNLVGLVFPSPGLYAIEFYCDDNPVLERRFHVTKAPSPPGKGPPPAEMGTD